MLKSVEEWVVFCFCALKLSLLHLTLEHALINFLFFAINAKLRDEIMRSSTGLRKRNSVVRLFSSTMPTIENETCRIFLTRTFSEG